ncbi:MAG: hypothetical protein P4M15_00995 [Alphaproteobacteria bacterium]|nr:hypothetical protein [Alphaproteobacteria bacterium]
MDEKLSYWGSVIFSAIALILVIVNISLANSNATLQRDVATRQSTINGGASLSQLNQSLIQALATAAFKNSNLEIRDLLTSQGITLRNDVNVPGTDAAPGSAVKKK